MLKQKVYEKGNKLEMWKSTLIINTMYVIITMWILNVDIIKVFE